MFPMRSEDDTARLSVISIQLQQDDTINSLRGIQSKLQRLQSNLQVQHRDQEIMKEHYLADTRFKGAIDLPSLTASISNDRQKYLESKEFENDQLHHTIAEFEETLSQLVCRHKEQMQNVAADLSKERQTYRDQLEVEKIRSDKLRLRISEIRSHIMHSHDLIKRTSDLHESEVSQRENTISRLTAENEGLQQLLLMSEIGGDDADEADGAEEQQSHNRHC
eukprot:TRINITY_DN11053_c0_g1_i1.p1 TRINITY_DN11053_c0_g1~~TRINITY_DN11053_c0_g1_i1.p1  ORF type:complete len:221 (-),score=47.17 TRINITY_DN11053_c0_g1_i1:165-827(-)